MKCQFIKSKFLTALFHDMKIGSWCFSRILLEKDINLTESYTCIRQLFLAVKVLIYSAALSNYGKGLN